MILLTGDSGFIGSYLASSLLAQGWAVRGIDVAQGIDLHYSQVTGNILDESSRKKAMQGVDCIVHLAAEHKDFGISQDAFYRVNVDGTKALLDSASQSDIKKFIFFSSVAVYGNTAFPSEDTDPHPLSHYGKSKLQAELLIRQWTQEDANRKAVIIRPTVVFGPKNRANIFKLIQYVCDGKFIWVGRGKNIKSIAYVENLVAATLFLTESMRSGIEVYNYVDEPQMNMSELVALIAQKAGLPAPTFSIPLSIALPAAKVLDVIGSLTHRDFAISTERIKKFNTSTRFQAQKIRSLGFKPPFSIEDGIEKNVQWYKNEFRAAKESIYSSFEE
jgi:nucleoside-diphosphate-sugar epimerase